MFLTVCWYFTKSEANQSHKNNLYLKRDKIYKIGSTPEIFFL